MSEENTLRQIILSGTELPPVDFDVYACWEEELSVSLVMAAGNMVKEIKDPGKVWRVRCSYDLLDDETYKAVLATLRGGDAFQAAVLPDNGEDMVVSQFFCVSLTPATFAFRDDDGAVVCHNLAFELREVEPHA